LCVASSAAHKGFVLKNAAGESSFRGGYKYFYGAAMFFKALE